MAYSAESYRPLHEWVEMDYNQRQQELKDRQVKEQARIIKEQRAINEQNENIYNYLNTIHNASLDRSEFLENAKIALTSAALYKVCRNSFREQLNNMDETVIHRLITDFVKEQGAGNLLNNWRYKNTTIAEMGRVIQESYNNILDSLSDIRSIYIKENEEDAPKQDDSDSQKDTLKLNSDQIDNFYDNLVDVDTDTASNEIHDRVKNAMNDFVDQNNKTKADCEDIINSAKAKMDITDNPETVEAIQAEAAREVEEVRRFRFKNPFHYLVESITKQYLKDSKLNSTNETKKLMESAIHSAKLIYSVLETLNTLEAVDESYITNFIKSTIEE